MDEIDLRGVLELNAIYRKIRNEIGLNKEVKFPSGRTVTVTPMSAEALGKWIEIHRQNEK